jgi:hypothetical protein
LSTRCHGVRLQSLSGRISIVYPSRAGAYEQLLSTLTAAMAPARARPSPLKETALVQPELPVGVAEGTAIVVVMVLFVPL